jgi:TolB protein
MLMLTRFFPGIKSLAPFALAAVAVCAFLASPSSAQQPRDLGTVDIVTDVRTTPIHITASTPELENLANQAFNAHGAFRRQAQNPTFRVNFVQAAPNQVQVTVTRAQGNAPVVSQVVSGGSPRNALYRAADVAVRAMTNRPGFFASRLAFIGERTGHHEVYTSDLFLGEVRQITSDRNLALTPRWSPDGGRIIYTSYFRSGSPDIFVMDLGTLQRNTFVSFKGTNSGARFSPDGRNVAMVLSGEGNPEIYVGNAQGRQITRKTRTTAIESSPVFSPDGSRILFTSDAAGGPQLYIMPAAGGTATRVPTRISGYVAEPDWSRANPNLVAFTARIGRNFQIGVHDLGTGASRQVSQQPFDAVEPSWLADGRHIVFSSRSAGLSGLWILDTETRRATQLSSASAGKLSQANVLDPR